MLKPLFDRNVHVFVLRGISLIQILEFKPFDFYVISLTKRTFCNIFWELKHKESFNFILSDLLPDLKNRDFTQKLILSHSH
jgi:hypothetical protein